MEWLFAEPIKDEGSIEEFERFIGYTFPDDFKKCVVENNGAVTKQNVFLNDKNIELMFDHLYSFNREDKPSIWRMNNWCNEDEKDAKDRYVAFGGGPFGDLLCFDKTNGKIVYIYHETMETEYVADTFTDFLNSLYEIED